MSAYYNEFDPYAAQWLRNLINAGHIAPGIVDERSIEDVHPNDLTGFTQCHFFAGIGVWSYALRAAGWPDARPVWTGSCPCQPFSAAGKGSGFDDQRHLWPAFHHLIQECKPSIVLGEQVASKDADPWIDLVQADVEALGYGFGAVPFPSASVGAPHIRDRLYWAADANGSAGGKGRSHVRGWADRGDAQSRAGLGRSGMSVGLANVHSDGCHEAGQCVTQAGCDGSAGDCAACGLADTTNERQHGRRASQTSNGRDAAWVEPERLCDGGRVVNTESRGRGARGIFSPVDEVSGRGADQRFAPSESSAYDGQLPSPVNGFWADADWLFCRDGKWRPVSPLPQPMADGSAESLGRVRSEVIDQIEEEVNAATAQSEGGRATAMRDLLGHLGAQAKRSWTFGGVPGLHEAPFLLAFLRQLQEQGWRIAECLSVPCPETSAPSLRGLRSDGEPSGTPCEHGLAGQLTRERADAVLVLSSLLARHARTAWDDAHAAYAELGFPLASGARSRAGRLKGYGNAINAEAARVFIECVMEAA